jgi:hypothetical protein
MRKALTVFIALLSLNAQSDLNIFGYFQTSAFFIDEITQYPKGSLLYDNTRNEFKMQQLNIFFQKDLGSNFSMWINLEFVNDFSTNKFWGTFQIEEAWVKYETSDLLNLKMGLFIPSFNRFNEIKNRMPLIPYIYRPIIYETMFKDVVLSSRFAPERGFFDIYGRHYLTDDLVTNYSFYLGQSDESFFVSEKYEFSMPTGTDSTTHFLLGGRVGFEYDFLRVGASGTIDKQKVLGTNIKRVGDTNEYIVDRKRLGFDLSLSYEGLFLEAEYVKVYYEHDTLSLDTDLEFYYGTLGYDFSEELTLYGSYSVLEDRGSQFFLEKMKNYSFGLVYRPSSSITLKGQYAHFYIDDFKLFLYYPTSTSVGRFNHKSFAFATSILF